MSHFFVVFHLVCERFHIIILFQNKLSSFLLKRQILSQQRVCGAVLDAVIHLPAKEKKQQQRKTPNKNQRTALVNFEELFCFKESPHGFNKAAWRVLQGVKHQHVLCCACRFKSVLLSLLHFYYLVQCVALPAADWGPVNERCCQKLGTQRGGSAVIEQSKVVHSSHI